MKPSLFGEKQSVQEQFRPAFCVLEREARGYRKSLSLDAKASYNPVLPFAPPTITRTGKRSQRYRDLVIHGTLAPQQNKYPTASYLYSETLRKGCSIRWAFRAMAKTIELTFGSPYTESASPFGVRMSGRTWGLLARIQ